MGEVDLSQSYGNAMRSISTSFTDDFSLIDLLHHVVEECRNVLEIEDVGVVLADRNGQLHILAATSERTSLVESLQIDTGNGPCMDSFKTGREAVVQDFYGRQDRFARLAHAQGFRSVYATPLRRHIYTMGALNLFASQPNAFTADRRAIADAFARICAMAVLVDRRGGAAEDRINEALQARIDIERAKGFVMHRDNVDEEAAFEIIHAHARENMISLVSVARDIRQLGANH